MHEHPFVGLGICHHVALHQLALAGWHAHELLVVVVALVGLDVVGMATNGLPPWLSLRMPKKPCMVCSVHLQLVALMVGNLDNHHVVDVHVEGLLAISWHKLGCCSKPHHLSCSRCLRQAAPHRSPRCSNQLASFVNRACCPGSSG